MDIVNFDKLTYAGNPESLSDLASDPRYDFVRGDISDPQAVADVFKRGFDALVNFAAETHVDRSIEDASPFLLTNVSGAQCLLEAARASKLPAIHPHQHGRSYGSAPAGGSFTEETILDPRSPYAASKASADHFVTHMPIPMASPQSFCVAPTTTALSNFPRNLIPLDHCQRARRQKAAHLRRWHAGARLAFRRRTIAGRSRWCLKKEKPARFTTFPRALLNRI